MWLESMSGGGILNIKFNDNISTENCTFYFGVNPMLAVNYTELRGNLREYME